MSDINYKIGVMQAYADGEKIEFRLWGRTPADNWKDTDNPDWDWHKLEYRIKEQPKEPDLDTKEQAARMSDRVNSLINELIDVNTSLKWLTEQVKNLEKKLDYHERFHPSQEVTE